MFYRSLLGALARSASRFGDGWRSGVKGRPPWSAAEARAALAWGGSSFGLACVGGYREGGPRATPSLAFLQKCRRSTRPVARVPTRLCLGPLRRPARAVPDPALEAVTMAGAKR